MSISTPSKPGSCLLMIPEPRERKTPEGSFSHDILESVKVGSSASMPGSRSFVFRFPIIA